MGKGDEHTAGWCQKEKPGVLAHSTPIYNTPEPRAREGPQETPSKPCSVLLATHVLQTEIPSLALFLHPGTTSSAHAAALPRDKASDAWGL